MALVDKEIITTWFQDYGDDVLNFLIYYTGRRDVDDLVQEVFVKALRRIETFNELSSPKTWLLSIARNTAIDDSRKRKKEREKIEKSWRFYEQKNFQSPEEVYQLSETNKEVYRAIQSLKRNYRDVLILKGIKDLSVTETSTILNWSKNKVKVTYHRALKSLEKKLGGQVDE